MKNRHTTFYVNKINQIDYCGSKMFELDLDGAFEIPFETTPTKGEHDYNECKGVSTVFREPN